MTEKTRAKKKKIKCSLAEDRITWDLVLDLYDKERECSQPLVHSPKTPVTGEAGPD